MVKTKTLSLITIGLLIFLPFVKGSSAQEAYVGTLDEDKYNRFLSVYKGNWREYFMDNLGETLNNLWPLGPTVEMTAVYFHWASQYAPPPSYEVVSKWPFTVTTVFPEEILRLLPDSESVCESVPVPSCKEDKLIVFPSDMDRFVPLNEIS